jgi:beta-N-acetylhexosaminidase
VRIGQTMLVTTTDVPRVRQWVADGLIAGLLANGQLGPKVARAMRRATADGRYGALLAADEEGGLVQRYRDLVGAIPSPQDQAWAMLPAQVRRMYAAHGEALAEWGVDMVMAPVVDVGHGPGIGSRAYSPDPEVVTRYGLAAAQGLADAGMIPVLKHFPGHGRSSGDSHDSLVTGPSIRKLRKVDLIPFREIPRRADVAVMVGHTSIPGYSELPSTQSAQAITGLLTEELGFSGLIVSDALGMAASGVESQGDALVGFVAAGGDLGIVGPGGSIEGRDAMRAALDAGTLPEDRLNDAAAAVLAAKDVDPCDVVGGPDPSATPSDTAGTSDDPVVNPTDTARTSDAPVINPTQETR